MKTNKYIIPIGTKVYNIYFCDTSLSHRNRFLNNQKLSTVKGENFDAVVSTEYSIIVDEFTTREENWYKYHYLWAKATNKKYGQLYFLIEKDVLENMK